jgi:hypothetical protein
MTGMRLIFTSISRSTLPPFLPEKRVRYRHRPLPPGWTRYSLTIPAGKERPDLEAV